MSKERKAAVRNDGQFSRLLSVTCRSLKDPILLSSFPAIMSDVFEGYERQYCELSIRKMDLEVRSLQPSVKAMLLAKLREYKSDINNLKREFKRITLGNANQSAREELLEAGMADIHAVSADQRERLSLSVERVNQSGDRIKESRRTMLETEQLGVSILEDLHQQRQTLLHSRNKLHGVDDAIDKSRKVLTAMSRRITKNEWIIGSVIVALVVAIVFIILFKISHH